MEKVKGDVIGAIVRQDPISFQFNLSNNSKDQRKMRDAYHIFLDGSSQKLSANLYHFSRIYFRFFSLLLWGIRFDEADGPSIRGGVQIPVGMHDKSVNVRWITDMVSAVDKFFHVKSYHHESSDPIATKKRIKIDFNAHYSFLPSQGLDSYILGSIIMGRPICPLRLQLLQPSRSNAAETTVRVLNRHKDRSISNAEEVVDYIAQVINSTRRIRNRVLYFDEKTLAPQFSSITDTDAMVMYKDTPLASQVSAMYDTDVLVAAHGAGLTNLVFMRPCSILIEIFPYHYAPHCYADYAAGVSVLYYKINTPLNRTVLSTEKSCRGVLPLVNDPAQAAALSCEWDESEKSKKCRFCARGNPSMSVDTKALGGILREALPQRERFMETHPAYATSTKPNNNRRS
jgi:hypothetical protein